MIAIKHLTVRLGGRTVLADASLAVPAGELLGLLGPNGAGKTTLLRTVLGLLKPVRGQVIVGGNLGYVPQRHEFAWDFPISVEDVVMTGRAGRLGLFRRPGIADWQAVDEALERVRMGDLRARPVGQLSGGQRQRVLVARALALRPSALLLDEPFTGLDVPTQELLSELFLSLAREERAVLMTTHDLAGAMHGCDRVALLNRTIVAVGTPAELADEDELWMRTFGIGERSPLLRVLKAVA
ncbi:anchored repeat-type ABC transporter ATP-binding subunit [Solirubrobacter taibaiensis]|nr:anchored repeat-type ABC transporter ATP-binding subunit [Solirubrobacter taibaiensis]